MPIDVDTLTNAIRSAWHSDTADNPDWWTPANPARGQCAVTAKVVQDYLGGTLVIAPVLRDGEPVEHHCWNVLPSGEQLDLTSDQFDFDYELGQPIEQEPIVDHTGVNRHLLLAGRVAEKLKRW